MTAGQIVGVLGASGAVGRAAVRELRDLGHTVALLGGRRLDALREVAREEPAGAGEVVRVDVADPESLAAFAERCDVVLNCAGPTYRLKATVAAAALAAGAHCVDVAGDDPAAEALLSRGDPAVSGRTVVLSAGTLPGLSSILPRWLARGLDGATALTAYCGGLEPCSPTVAEDLMLSLTTGGAGGAAYGEPLAAWRAGRRQSRALRPVEDAAAPGFPCRAAVQPFLSAETERLAADLALDRVDWFNVHPGPQVRALLNRLPGSLAAGADRGDLAERMMLAARLDLAGRTPFYVMHFALEGSAGGEPVSRRLTVLTASSYRLTAAVGALAVDAVLRGDVPPGVHFACDVLNPESVAGWIRESGAARFEPSGEARADGSAPCEGAATDADRLVDEGAL
ncbi:saccharopine dehydrogenase NADP-binding domain-containing protein [Actinoallomurus spadix]|uniref:Saccharopine dehydrogenase NADP-binding domain-containing protein n=1 Tax=Actinoallomurus spadix TaxID=79912 RepID=A0ABN0WE71_9ACTN|nr:saccharopine dehydrogenase NADP-binding domain-containing protein [Actinoallomurus spadix]MCO5987223.1 saccharopine dehydrogenase NADP-binding domain-containing protein [Actinoallomurus spadix]